MPRAKSYSKTELAERAMNVFWSNGYDATSLDDLVAATQASRHGIYSDFGGKHALFLASLDAYQGAIVSPALSRLEAVNPSFSDLRAYFETQISLAETKGLPGPGCLVANTMTEIAPRDGEVQQRVEAHNERLHRAFVNVLQTEAPKRAVDSCEALADILVVFAQGLWAMSRVVAEASILRRNVGDFLELISERIHYE